MSLYVCDTGNHRILKYFNAEWSEFYLGGKNLRDPKGVAVFGDSVFISCAGGVFRSMNKGQSVSLFSIGTDLSSPQQLAYDADTDSLFLVDRVRGGVGIISKASSSIPDMQFISLAGEMGKFNHPNGIAYSGGDLFVADTENNRVLMLRDGSWSSLGEGLYYPKSVCCAAGSLVVADTGNNCIKYFNFTDNCWFVGVDGLNRPEGVCVTPEGIFVSDTGGGSILTLAGGEVKSLYERKEMTDVSPPNFKVSLPTTLFYESSF